MVPYVHSPDPLGLFVVGELPPFAADLGVLALALIVTIGGDGDRDQKRKEENAKDTEEGGHL